ncbi:cell division ATP-binding protein FtsE, partial [Bacillus tequilensis]|nr:cell division ATP-binding protein FtsE [Bacillus tequilensis]
NLDPATSVGIMQLRTRINAGGTTVVMATHEAAFVDQMQRRVIELEGGEMVRDEVGGGYGDTSSIPRLTPETVPGAAAAAALTAVQEVQRETLSAAATPPAEPSVAPAQQPAADAASPAARNDQRPPAVPTPPEEPATTVGPRTNPIVIPEVEVAELGMADRLGLSRDDDEEVGPTS